MKLLRVISSMHPRFGGPSEGIRNSIPELRKLGILNDVVCLDDQDEAFIGKDDFRIIAVGQGKGSWRFNKNLVAWLLNNLHNYDAVIVHGLWQYPTYAVHQVVRQLKNKNKDGLDIPPIYVMPHGMLDPYFQKASGRKLKALRNWLYWKLIEGKVLNQADGVLFTCQEELLLAKATFSPYVPKREINVGYGIKAPPEFNDGMPGTFLDICPGVINKSYLLFLSRIHEKKGVDILVNAYKKILVENTHMEIPKLVIAGPGLDTPFGEKILQMIADYKDYIFFAGMLKGDSKWGAFYGCEAFILPSHQENFGLAVVESLACSKPVLISNKINIWREIEAGAGGIVGPDTIDGTSELIKKWINFSKTDKQTMEQNALTVYREKFGIVNAAQKLASELFNIS